MSTSFETSRELNGLGASSRGTKRTADDLTMSQPLEGGDTKYQWKRKPTRIDTKKIANPYNNIGARQTRNPTASATITDLQQQSKRKKITANGFNGLPEIRPSGFTRNGKMSLHSPVLSQAVPSTVRAGTSRDRETLGLPLSKSGGDTARSNGETSSTNPRRLSAEIIAIDESDPEADLLPRKPASSAGDDLEQPSPSPRESKSHPRVPTLATEFGVSEPGRLHPFHTSSSPPPSKPSARPRARGIAKDGESTKRLHEKFAYQGPGSLLNRQSSSLFSPPPSERPASQLLLACTSSKVEEAEEIDDVDEFSDPPRASSSRTPSTSKPSSKSTKLKQSPAKEPAAQVTEIETIDDADTSDPPQASSLKTYSRLSKRESTPGKASIKEGRVREMTEIIEKEEKSKGSGIKFITDLKKAGVPKSRIGAMKGKDTAISVATRGKGTISQSRSNRRDSIATAQTPYSKIIALPLDVCVWGNLVSSVNNDVTPAFWLHWNEDAEELQLYKDPLGDLKKKCIKNIKFSHLKGYTTTFSDERDYYLIQFSPNDKSRRDVLDNNEDIELTFKFLSRHTNTTLYWSDLFSRLKTFNEESGTKMDRVIGTSAKQCLEGALLTAGNSGPKSRRKGNKAIEPPSIDSDDSNSSRKGARTQTLSKKPQPKPRAVKKANQDQHPNQNITTMFNESAARRSSRLLAEETRHDSPPANLDEIILVYPPSGLGAVNISNGDLRRLEPSEFLNDTLIELGLKFWLNDLREKQPELAEEVHVFSSFFFKKLASKNNKTAEDGHKSVRKWTAKVDIFKKKYIIVPINENIHWYLAIIYHPEHILEPSLPKPPPRSSKRVSHATANKGSSPIKGVATRSSKLERLNSFENHIQPPVSSVTTRTNDSDAEAEIEKELTEDTETDVANILGSCSIDDSQPTPQSRTMSPEGALAYPVEGSDIDFPEILGHIEGGGPSSKPLDSEDSVVVDDSLSEGSHESGAEEEIDELDQDDDHEPSTSYLVDSGSGTPLLSRFEVQRPAPGDLEDAGIPMDVDSDTNESQLPARETSVSNSIDAMDEDVGDDTPAMTAQDEQLQQNTAVPPQSFYSKKAVGTYDGRKHLPKDLDPELRLTTEDDELNMFAKHDADRQSSEEPEVIHQKRSIIFCMDSLGSTHPKAMSRLNDYLQEEAKDKKGVESPSSALVKKALVPAQPNFCDCGLYLMHFAQTFMTDPEKYKAAIFATKKASAGDRNVLWHNDQVATMREGMKARILEESEKWKKIKADKGQKEQENKAPTGDGVASQQPVSVEDSDDEIVVSEVRHVGVPSPKKRTKAPRTPAARIR